MQQREESACRALDLTLWTAVPAPTYDRFLTILPIDSSPQFWSRHFLPSCTPLRGQHTTLRDTGAGCLLSAHHRCGGRPPIRTSSGGSSSNRSRLARSHHMPWRVSATSASTSTSTYNNISNYKIRACLTIPLHKIKTVLPAAWSQQPTIPGRVPTPTSLPRTVTSTHKLPRAGPLCFQHTSHGPASPAKRKIPVSVPLTHTTETTVAAEPQCETRMSRLPRRSRASKLRLAEETTEEIKSPRLRLWTGTGQDFEQEVWGLVSWGRLGWGRRGFGFLDSSFCWMISWIYFWTITLGCLLCHTITYLTCESSHIRELCCHNIHLARHPPPNTGT